ncbi:MAG: EF-P lysine aminoacylase EpmA [Syntrophaceae bacterium]
MMANGESMGAAQKRSSLWTRAKMIHAIREFFIGRDYLEVETPNLIPELIPEHHIDAISCSDWFLHTSPELYMKRLLVAGYPRIFQICRCFRKGERGSNHLPEFTMLEWYCKDMDYKLLMKECEELIISVASTLGNGDLIHYQGNPIRLKESWEYISVQEAFASYAPMQMDEAMREDCFDEAMVCYIEPRLGLERPTFIYDYPVSGAVLAKAKTNNSTVAERFELYMGGKEIANACSELTGRDEHCIRFEKVMEYRRSAGKPEYPMPDRFLQEIDDMPEAAGIALGVDRLAMIFCDSTKIDNVVTFIPEKL